MMSMLIFNIFEILQQTFWGLILHANNIFFKHVRNIFFHMLLFFFSGVICASFSSGLGEISFLSYSSFFDK